jgi:hypothetical protein
MNPMLQKLKNKVWSQLLIIYTRYLIGATFVFASIIKIKGRRFTSESGAETPIDNAWHLFETLYQSGLYWQFLGAAQLVAGLLLMTQRYSKLGALMFLPIIANIFVITLSYYFAFTPVITGLMLLANLALVAWDWDELRVLVNRNPNHGTPDRLEHQKIWEWTGLALFLFTVIYRILTDEYDVVFWGSGCTLITIIGTSTWLWNLKATNKGLAKSG